MKKSIFKRGIASATGILLAATQLGVLAANVGAADAVTIDASYLTDVPVAVNLEGVLEYTDGSWYNLLYAAYTAADALDQEVSLESAKNAVQNVLGAYVDADALEAIVDAVSDAKLTGNAGKYQLTVEVAECGPAVGAVIAEKLAGVKGADIDMNVSGTLNIAIDMTTENSIAWEVSFAAEDGNTYTVDTIDSYVEDKLTTALTAVDAADKVAAAMDKINAAKDVVDSVSVSATDFESAYSQYVAALPETVAAKMPAALADAIANEKVNAAFDKVIGAVNDAQDIAEINLTIADLAGIAADAYDIQIVGEGASVSAQFSIADDQNAELLAAFQEYYTTIDLLAELEEYFVEDYVLAEGYTYEVVDVESHKELYVAAGLYGGMYEIVRVIDSVTLEVVEIPVEYSYELVVDAAPTNAGYYWSDEEEAFDLTELDVILNVYVDGELAESIAVADEYFAADAASASEIAYIGYGAYDVTVALTAEGAAALEAQVAELGYDTATMINVGIAEGLEVCTFSVTLMTRGDVSLDGEVDTADAIAALQIYTYGTILGYAPEVIAENIQSVDLAAAFYAGDLDATSAIDSADATDILVYYTSATILQKDVAWDDVTGFDVTHTVDQHIAPLASLAVAE